MRTVNLFIENEKLDLFKDESIQVTQTIQNTKDIGSVFSNFSASFAVPASPVNNKIFKYYYKYDVINGFDARYKVSGKIEIGGLVFDTGFFKLNNVKLKDSKPHTYNLTFFGELVSLKDIFGEDNLDSLDWSGYILPYTQTDVADKLENGLTVDGEADAIITPLIISEFDYDLPSATQYDVNKFNILSYAVKIKSILKVIENTYGISFVGSFLTNNVPLQRLYMWLKREKGIVALPENNYDNIWVSQQVGDLWTLFANGEAGSSYEWGWEYNGGSQGPEEARSHEVTLFLDVDTTDEFSIDLYHDSTLFWTGTYQGANSYQVEFNNGNEIFDEGTYEVRIRHSTPIGVLTSSYWKYTLNIIMDSGPGYVEIDNQTQDAHIFGSDFQFQLADKIPEMKVLDFVIALFKMFNLTAYKDPNGNIVLQELDDFYSNGIVRDWTQYIDDRNTTISPVTLYREMEFAYEGLDTILADQHSKLAGKGWGTERYSAGNKYEGTKYEIKLPFEHMKFERLFFNTTQTDFMHGLFTDSKNEPYIGKPCVFLAENETGNVRVYDVNGANPISKTSYFMPKNVLDSGDSINFSAEFNEYTNTLASDSLFANYYSNYISGVFDVQTRLYKLSGQLPLSELISYNLNDTIKIRDDRFLINSITTDVTTGKSEIELKNIV